MKPPPYFEHVRQNAAKRWNQLETDPELAGPWHQLFSQVQSPPHVLSELLQNADDAGATRAAAGVENGVFIFQHNGQDFTAEQFASLCRFAFSNKRTLHTIGFRGVGFKSTFSLGDEVDVLTPSLAVRFHRSRFTLPVWNDSAPPLELTEVRVKVADEHRLRELEQSLQQWSTSPASLLFFLNLRELELNGRSISKQKVGDGPVLGSELIALTHLDKLNRPKTDHLLVVQSEPEAFPADAIQEIRKERNLQEQDFPPCKVELVLGISDQQRIYVVLPTGAELDLPFSINAPFMQDAARLGIKEPSISPTNRWLLKRAGELTAKLLVRWTASGTLSLEDRARAYSLIPKAEKPGDDARGRTTIPVREAFLGGIGKQPVILIADGTLSPSGTAFSLPQEIHDIWPEGSLVHLFGPKDAKLLSSVVSSNHCQRLHAHGWVKDLSTDEVLACLRAPGVQPPRPAAWSQLHALWSFVCKSTNRYWDDRPKKVAIVPVQGSPHLHPAEQVVRLPARRDQLTADDWQFVTDHSLALDDDWVEWLGQLKTRKKEEGTQQEDVVVTFLGQLGLQEATPVDVIVGAASKRLFADKQISIEDCVRFAHIMAALKARVPDGFKYVTRDRVLRDPSHHVVHDPSGCVEDVSPEQWSKQHLLHELYTAHFTSCTASVWDTWAGSELSLLSVGVPIEFQPENFWGSYQFEKRLEQRGARKARGYPYSWSYAPQIQIKDWNVSSEVLAHWKALEPGKPQVWQLALMTVLKGPAHGWNGKLEAAAWQLGPRYNKMVDCVGLIAGWIALFRSKVCLPDTQGRLRQPAELLLRTPDTEPLRDIEPFIDANLDTAGNRPLLELLGVRSTPSGARKVLERLEALSKISEPQRLVIEINKLYEALDRIVARCAPTDLQVIADELCKKPLILSESAVWLTSGEISIYSDEENQAPAIHHFFQNLAMWLRLGVAERPAIERSLDWLRSLPSGERIEPAASARVRLILRRDPERVWDECTHWLSLDQTWEPTARLANRQTMQNLGKWEGLAPAVKRATADFRMLPEMTWQQPPFAGLRDLGEVVEFQVTEVRESAGGGTKPWLTELGNGLCRVKFDDEERTERIRSVARRLADTVWKPFNRLEVTPYVDGTPAGMPMTPRILWQDVNLYVAANISVAKLHKELADEIARPFGDRVIAEAITACIERSADYVAEYLTGQFQLDEQMELQPTGRQTAGAEQDEEQATAGSTAEEGGQEAVDKSLEAVVTESHTEDEAGETESGDEGSTVPDQPESARPQKSSSPPKPDLMDRYAESRGFKWHAGGKCYAHQDGRWIEKAESPFNWGEHAPDGELICRLWVSDQKLTNGIEVAAELWNLLSQQPSETAIVVVGDNHLPCALTGRKLLELKEAHRVTLYPARYRIVETEQLGSSVPHD